ncbi:MAG: class I SAM-dependent methyltransferase [Dehalococcoidia bacterium]|nr:class I SAM-dependent methyltransferase [Dehalococcoidia bacterium]
MRYPRMSVGRRVAALSAALENECARLVHYPAWYMRHRHFLPGGYLSHRSAALYERAVGPLYNLPGPGVVRQAIARTVVEHAPQRILELGCGTGGLLQFLRQEMPGASLHGLDLSPFLLEHAKSALAAERSDIELHHDDASRFRAVDRFDAVVAVHLLGHIPTKDGGAVFRNAITHLLAPGGVFHVVEHRWHKPRWSHRFQPAATTLLTPLLVHRQYQAGSMVPPIGEAIT